jgi:POT family proton-dependent oligopeptide transporter
VFVFHIDRLPDDVDVPFYFIVYWLAYGQISNNLISQGATMTFGHVPNEIVSNLDPLSIIIFVPLFEFVVYPGLRRLGINFTALQKIFCGFMCAAAAMVWAAVLQYYIYKTSNCGKFAGGEGCVSPISVWVQVGSYALVGLSEIFASVVSLEIAFTLAPKNMRSLVMSVGLFTSAIGSAIQEAFIPITKDPLLVWMYTSVAGITFVAGVLFAVLYRDLDKQLDELYNLGPSQYADPKSVQAEVIDVELQSKTPSEKGSIH